MSGPRDIGASTAVERCANPNCQHAKHRHETPGFDGECIAALCKCTRFVAKDTAPAPAAPLQAAPAPAAPSTPVPVVGPSTDQLIAAGKRSASKRTVTLAERIEAQLLELRTRLHDDRRTAEEAQRREQERTAAAAEVAKLKAALAAAKAKLHGRTPPRTKSTTPAAPGLGGPHPCPVTGCDRSFVSTQAAAMHRRRAHEGFNPGRREAG